MNHLASTQQRSLTLAEICEAINSGRLQAKVENGNYQVRRSDLLTLARRMEVKQATLAQRPAELAS